MSDFRNRIDDLAMLYLQDQDLSKMSPEQVLALYADVRNKMQEEYKRLINSKA